MTTAFSLVEIMVAVGLLAVIMVGLLAMFYQTQRAFRAGMAQVDVLEGGRAAMELISRDLQEVCASLETPVTNFEARVPTGYTPLAIELTAPDPPANTTLEDVSFLRRANDEWTAGSYQVSNAVAGVGTLYRLLVTGGRANVGTLVDFARTTITGNNTPMLTNFMRVADGVVHFRVRPYDSRGLLIVSN